MKKWMEVRTAYQVAKLGTVTAAAKNLGVDRATVNRHIDVLEAELQTKLFLRNKRGYTLTDAGEKLLRVAHKADEMFTDFAGKIRFGDIETVNEIVISVHSALSSLLMHSIIAFQQEYPNTQVRILAQDSLAKLEYGEAHVALAFQNKPEEPDYVVQSFGSIRFGIYAHSRYGSRKGLPNSIDEFVKHNFIANPEYASINPIEAWILDNVPERELALKSSHPRVTHEAIMSGVAIGILPEPFTFLRDDLHVVVEPKEDWNIPIWLVTHVDLHRGKKIQKMLECIKDTLILRD